MLSFWFEWLNEIMNSAHFTPISSNGCHSGLKIFKPEKNLEFFRLKF